MSAKGLGPSNAPGNANQGQGHKDKAVRHVRDDNGGRIMANINRCPADVAFSKAYRMSRSFTCEHCGNADGKTELAHIWGRRAKSVRWDTLNALCLCHTCHRSFTENPLDFQAWLQGYVGQGYLDILNEKRNTLLKTTEAYRKEVAKHYRDQAKLLEGGRHDLVSFQ